MLHFYKTDGVIIRQIDSYEEGCWVNMVNPTEDELGTVVGQTGVELPFLKAALDDEETSRIEMEEGYTLLIVDVPVSEQDDDGRFLFSTLPLGIIVCPKAVITVALKETSVVEDFAKGLVRGAETSQKTRFILMLMLRAASRYLFHLRQIEKASTRIEGELYKSQKNKELIQLLKLEKSLVFFNTSLKSTETTLEKLLRGRILKLYEEDQDLLEDVIIEFKQAIEMADIYSSILSGTMDAFASVISNNLNIIMKVLTLITIFMTIPTVVFSYYGMNVDVLPYATSWFPIVLSLVAVGGVWVFLKKKNLY